MKKKVLLLFLLGVLLSGGIFVFRFLSLKKPTKQVSLNQPKENLEQKEVSFQNNLENFQYIGGEKDCCVCSGIASLYKYNGGSEEIFETLAPMAINHDLSYLTSALKQFNLQDKLYLGYYYQGETKEARSEMLKDFQENLADPQKQIKLFKNENEAFETLKSLIAANKPVMFAWEDSQRLGSPQEECQDDTYNVAVGLDNNQIIFYTLPGIKSQSSISEFKEKWKLQNTQFCYWIFPGSYTLIWLEK